MTQKYNLYDILFEEPAKRIDLKARLAAMQRNKPFAASPSGKMEMHPHQILIGMQSKIKDELSTISKLAKETDPSKEDVSAAKKALDDVENNVNAIANLQGYTTEPEKKSETKTKEPKPESKQSVVSPTAKTEPQQTVTNIGTAKTEPQMPAVRQPAQTQPVPQVDIEKMMRNAPTSQMPNTAPTAQKPSMFQRLKQRVGLEEVIKDSVKAALKNR
jgi:hypothetical protein